MRGLRASFFNVIYLSNQFSDKALQLRTKENYEAHCADLGGPLNDHIATTFGIVRNSILNNLNFFHVTSGLVPDIMHNILEGIGQINAFHINTYIIQDGVFNVMYFF